MGESASDRSVMTVPRFVAAKAEGRRLVMLTAYDALWSGLFDQAGVLSATAHIEALIVELAAEMERDERLAIAAGAGSC